MCGVIEHRLPSKTLTPSYLFLKSDDEGDRLQVIVTTNEAYYGLPRHIFHLIHHECDSFWFYDEGEGNVQKFGAPSYESATLLPRQFFSKSITQDMHFASFSQVRNFIDKRNMLIIHILLYMNFKILIINNFFY